MAKRIDGRRRLLLGAAVCLIGTGGLPLQAAAQAEGDPEAGRLDEIVVTAQRREEDLQDVPIAVAAIGEETLKNIGITNTAQISQIVPSVQLTRSGPSGLIFIRGVGSTNAQSGDEGSNAVYIDGVYLGDLSQAFTNFNNIQRIEVLKGPQGTLFGRNSTGGLIQIITREPGDDYVLSGQAGFANYDTWSGQLYAAGPLGEKVSMDVALTGLDQNKGWGRNLTLDRESKTQNYWGARSKIVARPAEGIKLTLAGDYNSNFDTTALDWKLKEGFLGFGGFAGPSGQNTTVNTPGRAKTKNWGVSLTGEADLGFATLTSVSALRKSDNRGVFDSDGGPTNRTNVGSNSQGRTIQQELRLASNGGGALSWQLGLFYLNVRAASQLLVSGDVLTPAGIRSTLNDGVLKTNSYAAFGEVTYAITPTTQIIAGVRYTIDDRALSGRILTTRLTGAVVPGTVVNSELHYKEPTYRVAIRQEITDRINVYASVNRGFKAGTFGLSDVTLPPVKPQFIMAYEAGLKAELFDRRLRFNLSGYHYDIDDYQVRTGSAAGTNTVFLLNAATVKVDGVDLDFEAAPTRAWRIFGGLTVLHSRFAKFGGEPIASTPQSPMLYPGPATCPANLRGTRNPGVLGAGPRTGGFTTCFGDVSGNDTSLAPRFTASIGSTYTIELPNDGELRLSALFSHNSGYLFEPSAVIRQRAFNLLNGSFEYRPNANLGVEVWVRNATNQDYEVSNLAGANGSTATLGAPRTYGVNFKFDF